ncbi:MAG: hypothetical protein EHM24_19720 [Acidobacteria bacterium]|nr:MAG: hypothetical protein EHM24_19720 [Acidobacteriota bacterium]
MTIGARLEGLTPLLAFGAAWLVEALAPPPWGRYANITAMAVVVGFLTWYLRRARALQRDAMETRDRLLALAKPLKEHAEWVRELESRRVGALRRQ